MSETAGPAPNSLPVDGATSPPGFACYRGSIPFDELPIPELPNQDDYDWAWNSRELHRQYQGKVVAVHDRRIWGVGKDWQTAWEDARQKAGCPELDALAFVPLHGMPGNPEGAETGAKLA